MAQGGVSRLLLIEDDPDIRKLLERYFERMGLVVVIATDGDEGLRAFERGRFDLVLIDGLLPKKTGFEVVPAMRKMAHGKEVGIIMMTAAFKTPKARKDAFDGGVDAFFTKPFVLSDLKLKVDELLARKNAAPLVQPVRAPAPVPVAIAVVVPVATVAPVDVPRAKIAQAKSEVPRREVPPLPDEITVESPTQVARILLQCARHRLSGTVRLAEEASALVIVFLRGVVVGASDNLREQLLGEMLWKQGRLTTEQMRDLSMRIAEKGERVAEALLALGFIGADEVLALVNDQVRARVRRALLWHGKLRVVVDEADALKRAVDSVELLDILIAFALEPAQQEEAQRFVAAYEGEALLRGTSFDDILAALARRRSESMLPGILLAGTPSVREAVAASSPSEVYAAHFAELVRLAEDPPADARPLPMVMRSEVDPALVDRALTNRVSELLLKARGSSAYALFDMPHTATDEEMIACADAMLAMVGNEVFVGGSLGPAMPAVRELCAILEDHRALFADPVRRAMHDAIWENLVPTAPAVAGPEGAFLDGQLALTNDDLLRAHACFEKAVAQRPNDAEYKSWLAWVRVLSGDSAGGIVALMSAMREDPQSMRPIFFLGLYAARSGELDKARALLLECTRRSPHDVEVQAALSALG